MAKSDKEVDTQDVEAVQLETKSGDDGAVVFAIDPLDNAVDHDTTNQREEHNALDLAYVYVEENTPPPPVTATGVTPGAPGTWTPADAEVPADLAALNALGALGQTTAWADGTFMTLGDGSSAYWDGTAWVAGTAPPTLPEADDQTAGKSTAAMKAAKSTRAK